MPKLHDALKALEPIDFSDVPLDKLDTFLKDIFSKAELVINSVPPPAGGEDFLSASLSQSDANVANSSADLTVSSARPPPRKSSYAELQKQWGKAIKLSAKENPLGTSMFKMAGNDRHGAWFTRSSVHEGIGFSKFKKALLQEFPETLKVEGGPGAGSIRGIGGDKRLERKTVDGVGSMEGKLRKLFQIDIVPCHLCIRSFSTLTFPITSLVLIVLIHYSQYTSFPPSFQARLLLANLLHSL